MPDIVVIGAGAVGAACAAELARRGHRVRILSHPARSTTSVSGGHLLLQSKRPGESLRMARRSLDLLQAFVQGREEDLGYRRTGSLLLAATDEEAAVLRAHFQALAAEGLPLEWLDGAAARELEPGLGADVIAASYCPLDAQVDPRALAGEWLQEAMAARAGITSGVLVESFVTSGGAVVGVVAGGAAFSAAAVVLAAGSWSGELAAMAGAAVELRPRRGVLLRSPAERAMATRPLLGASYLQAKFSDEPCAVAFSFQQHPDGECVLGGSREFVGFSAEGAEALREPILECAARYLPAVRELPWEQVDAGFRPWTADGLPRIGRSEVPGLYLACGHEGDGIMLAAATAERIAAEMEGTRPAPAVSGDSRNLSKGRPKRRR